MSTEALFLDVISGRRRGPAASAARLALGCGEPAYRTAVVIRNRLFDGGLRRAYRIKAPVLSVGNLTTGGTGKTPVVAAIVEALRQRGGWPGVASRGYRSLDAGGNDEQRVLQILCPDLPHRQNRDRVRAARELVQDGCSAIVLDDGFQHRRLHRDLDIVLVDATNPWGFGRLLPRGLLREPRSSLRRADLVVITRADLVPSAAVANVQDAIRRETVASIVTTRFVPTGLRDSSGDRLPLERLRGERVSAFCGIGNPDAFRLTLESLGATVEETAFRSFPDHHAYSMADVSELQQAARHRRSDVLVCTLKDLVKISGVRPDGPPVLALEIGLDITSGQEAWDARLSPFHGCSPHRL